ncbi:uncharacterized protein LOC113215439 [Frankliniella occidentalis]|uniref:Uncharacterized protein LOC113215439 n=1 Tax=Frankliniella occidentalis TaxID=133901 RepID=A0A6J1TDP1_FRAOC|nr:uncharacterized protein LOC113215439 [Frankliniella occidentalis]
MLKLNGGNNDNLFGPGSPSTHSPASSPLILSPVRSPPSSPADELEVRSKGVTPSEAKGITPSAAKGVTPTASNLQGTATAHMGACQKNVHTPVLVVFLLYKIAV